jgi:hypothetical protein
MNAGPSSAPTAHRVNRDRFASGVHASWARRVVRCAEAISARRKRRTAFVLFANLGAPLSMTWPFFDMREDSANYPTYEVVMDGWPNQPQNHKFMFDLPGFYHHRAGGFSFADGTRKCAAGETRGPFRRWALRTKARGTSGSKSTQRQITPTSTGCRNAPLGRCANQPCCFPDGGRSVATRRLEYDRTGRPRVGSGPRTGLCRRDWAPWLFCSKSGDHHCLPARSSVQHQPRV